MWNVKKISGQREANVNRPASCQSSETTFVEGEAGAFTTFKPKPKPKPSTLLLWYLPKSSLDIQRHKIPHWFIHSSFLKLSGWELMNWLASVLLAFQRSEKVQTANTRIAAQSERRACFPLPLQTYELFNIWNFSPLWKLRSSSVRAS